MAGNKTITELTTLATVDKNNDWLPVVDVSDTTESSYGTTKKALVDQFIGDTGAAATVDAGTTTTGIAGSNASVVNSGTTSAAVFDFAIPRGDKGEVGEQGIQGIQGETGAAGADGDDAYVYIAYASDANGTGFTTTFNASLNYIAIKSTATVIASPQASDFTGLWKNYKGETGSTGAAGADGTDGVDGDSAYVYIAYASDASGTGFTTTFNSALDYIAIKPTDTEIVSPQASDFAGLWKNYKGETGETGATGAAGTNGTDGEDGLDITWRGTYAAETAYVINDAVYYSGGSYICILGSTGNLPTNETYWNLMAAQGATGEGSGDVAGPDGATDNAVVRYDLTTGKLIQNSLVTIDDSGSVNIPSGQQYLVNGSPVSGYSDEQAQDAVGTILTDSTEIDFTYTDETPSITAALKSASIDETKLDTSVNASLDLADSAVQGPASATANGIAVFDSTTGKLIKDTDGVGYGPFTISEGTLAGESATGCTIQADTIIGTGIGPMGDGVKTGRIIEYSVDTGVTVEEVLIKDGLVDGRDVSADGTALDGKIAKTTNITALNETGIADGEIAVFNLTNKDIRTSNVLISTDGTLAGDADTNVPTEKAVKTYIDGTKFVWKGAWATSTAYVLNDVIEENGSAYICVTAHTSGTFATDLSAGKWDLFVEGFDETAVQTLTNKKVQLTAELGTDHTASGTTILLTATANVAFGDVCYIASTGKASLIDADAIASMSAIVMAIATISADASGEFLLMGIARDDTWAWTVGGLMYGTVTGTTGNTLSQTAPTGTDDVVQILGVATHADRVFFNPQLVQIERA